MFWLPMGVKGLTGSCSRIFAGVVNHSKRSDGLLWM